MRPSGARGFLPPVQEGSTSPWELTEHLGDRRICEAALAVAEGSYPDLLGKVRANVARAMSGWLMKDGCRAHLRWSDESNSFVGQLRVAGEDVLSFEGLTPGEVQEAFTQAVNRHLGLQEATPPGDPRDQAPGGPVTIAPLAAPTTRKRKRKPPVKIENAPG